MSVRVRFAPSPTGLLHLGNVRIAVFNWLLARHHGGSFIVRIEDTDVERGVAGSEAAILADLRWLGLDCDEGPDVGGPCEPYRQSERGVVHRAAVEGLLASERAYRCWCTPEALGTRLSGAASARRKRGSDAAQRYAGTCRELSADRQRELESSGRTSVVRFRLPETDSVTVEDALRGSVTFPMSDLDDFVLLRADGRATYNLAVVVDDIAMEITHVIRGAGHLSNTHKQAVLFDALGGPRPVFAHLPTVLGGDGQPLSKRHRSDSLEDLRKRGYHPVAIVNYLSLLGWSSSDGREVLNLEELVERTSLERVGSANTMLDPDKLLWMSGQHIARMDLDELVAAVRPRLAKIDLPRERVAATVAALRSRLQTLGDINEHLHLIHPLAAALDAAHEEPRKDPLARSLLQAVRAGLAAESTWEAARLGRAVRTAGTHVGVTGPRLFHPVRQALTATSSGPDLGQVLAAIGREEALARLSAALSGGASEPAGGRPEESTPTEACR